MRQAIFSQERLAVTLHYFATGKKISSATSAIVRVICVRGGEAGGALAPPVGVRCPFWAISYILGDFASKFRAIHIF